MLFASLLLVVSLAGLAIMQAPPPAELAEWDCRQLGIEPEKCTEQAIPGRRMGNFEQTQTQLDPALLSILAGCAAAFVAGIIYVKRASREKSNQKPQ